MHALRSWWLTLYHRGWVSRPTPALLSFLWTAAIAALMHQYEVDAPALNKKLKQGLGFLVGPAVGDVKTPRRTPQHQPVGKAVTPPPMPLQ